MARRKSSVPAPLPALPKVSASRVDIINRILAAARRPIPDVAEIRYLLATDGKYYGALGFPAGVRAIEPYEMKVVGYAIRTPEGTTIGTREATREAVLTRHEAAQDRDA